MTGAALKGEEALKRELLSSGGFFNTPGANPLCAVGGGGMWPILVNTGPRNAELRSKERVVTSNNRWPEETLAFAVARL